MCSITCCAVWIRSWISGSKEKQMVLIFYSGLLRCLEECRCQKTYSIISMILFMKNQQKFVKNFHKFHHSTRFKRNFDYFSKFRIYYENIYISHAMPYSYPFSMPQFFVPTFSQASISTFSILAPSLKSIPPSLLISILKSMIFLSSHYDLHHQILSMSPAF